MIKVFVVDDHSLIRDGIKRVLSKEKNIEVIGEAKNSDETIQKLSCLNPDVVTVDISLEEKLSGLNLIRAIVDRYPKIKIITISMYDSPIYTDRAIKAGAHAYVTKNVASGKMGEIIKKVFNGEIYVEESLKNILMKYLLKDFSEEKSALLLSDRELEYFTFLGNGLSKSEIIKRMHVSTYAIESYRRRIKKKLSINNASLLSKCAFDWVKNNNLME